DHSQPLGGASQEIRGATGAHQPARAPTAANAEAATFGALHEDQGNERRGNDALEDGKKDEQRHERSLASLRGHLGGRLPSSKVPPCSSGDGARPQASPRSAAATMMPRNDSAVRLAPPTRAPPTSSAASSSAALSGLTEP